MQHPVWTPVWGGLWTQGCPCPADRTVPALCCLKHWKRWWPSCPSSRGWWSCGWGFRGGCSGLGWVLQACWQVSAGLCRETWCYKRRSVAISISSTSGDTRFPYGFCVPSARAGEAGQLSSSAHGVLAAGTRTETFRIGIIHRIYYPVRMKSPHLQSWRTQRALEGVLVQWGCG